MEMDITLRLDEQADTHAELFEMTKQEAMQLSKDLHTRILLTGAKTAFLEMMSENEGESKKLAWLIFTYGRISGMSSSLDNLITNGAEKFIQGYMSEQMNFLLNSGASIVEIREAIAKK